MSIFNITPASFESGLMYIATNVHAEDELQEFINKYEVECLQDMLGAALYTLFVADLTNGVPQSAIYLSLFNAFCLDDTFCGLRRSEGIKLMLQKFIFWEYVRYQKVKNTNQGNVVNSAEASRESSFPESKLYSLYNEGIKTYKNIQWYICEHSSDYPTFQGIVKSKTSWL